MDTLPVPGIVMGSYPERRNVVEDAFARGALRTAEAFASLGGGRLRRYRRFVEHVRALEATQEGAGASLEAEVANVRASLARNGFTEPLLARAFLVVKQACRRVLGIDLYDTQLMAARIMLDGRLAEMATGEGKTVAAGVCAAAAALARVPVHVITANEYLVVRDAQTLEPLYRALGLTVGHVTQAADETARRAAYGCDVTYCTAKDLVFDYLRDRLVRERLRSDLHLRAERLGRSGAAPAATLLRGLCMAVVDEADSTLIDEARVPLILSQARASPAADHYRRALDLAHALKPGRDFRIDSAAMCAELTAAGSAVVTGRASALEGLWRNRRQREELICTALAAVHLYAKDRHYLVQDGEVCVIDQTTGRVSPGRIWAGGLHQLVEAKEGLGAASELVTIAQITYQRFFRRYLRLAGMSGTLAEERDELCAVYGLRTVKVPLQRPSRRRLLGTTLYPDMNAVWRAVVERAGEVSRGGRPVLIGTDSVLESEMLSQRLAAAGLAHAVLNARHDRDEARIVAQAGAPGQITVATNMAGRGTDIPLSPESAHRGGLHLISCQHNPSRRIDRQLLGRCARRGDPGTAETRLALNKPLIARLFPAWLERLVAQDGTVLPEWAVALVLRLPQRLEERRLRRARRAMLEHDSRAERRSLIGSSAE
jgi:preprotein translocase subunit SecA